MLKNQKGMTLIEIMIVIAIIGGLISILVPNILDSYTKARVKQSVIQLNNIKNALRNYLVDCGSFPSSEAGIEALAADPGREVCSNWGPGAYIERRQLTDQFNHPFDYEFDGEKAFITFLGKDGRKGGTKYNTDVTEEQSTD
jgi:general secretion pathway protein G